MNRSLGILRPVALVRTDVSVERIASNIRVTTTVLLRSVLRLLVTDNVLSSPFLVTLLMVAICSSELSVLQEPHGVTSR
jgi:hypothetical protein